MTSMRAKHTYRDRFGDRFGRGDDTFQLGNGKV